MDDLLNEFHKEKAQEKLAKDINKASNINVNLYANNIPSNFQEIKKKITSKQSTIKISDHSHGENTLKEVFAKYCNARPVTQDEINMKVYRGRQSLKPYQIFIDLGKGTHQPIMGCWIKGLPTDGRLIVRASFNQQL